MGCYMRYSTEYPIRWGGIQGGLYEVFHTYSIRHSIRYSIGQSTGHSVGYSRMYSKKNSLGYRVFH